MNIQEVKALKSIKEQVESELSGEGSGHDWYHVERVWKTSKKIAESIENIDFFVVEAGALLHDIADHKFHNGDANVGPETAAKILKSFSLYEGKVEKIVDIVKEISFKGAGVPTKMSSLEGMIVQDADRLDAIGAIGIARAFAYGGFKKHPIYDPFIKPICHTSFDAYKNSTAPSINHFYEKLLLLKDLMNTDAAKTIAEKRHKFMEDFLSQFYLEWG